MALFVYFDRFMIVLGHDFKANDRFSVNDCAEVLALTTVFLMKDVFKTGDLRLGFRQPLRLVYFINAVKMFAFGMMDGLLWKSFGF